jgi:hypothetical protein
MKTEQVWPFILTAPHSPIRVPGWVLMPIGFAVGVRDPGWSEARLQEERRRAGDCDSCRLTMPATGPI